MSRRKKGGTQRRFRTDPILSPTQRSDSPLNSSVCGVGHLSSCCTDLSLCHFNSLLPLFCPYFFNFFTPSLSSCISCKQSFTRVTQRCFSPDDNPLGISTLAHPTTLASSFFQSLVFVLTAAGRREERREVHVDG